MSYQYVDADGHYYEPDDFFTRHIAPQYRDRTIHIVRENPDGIGQVFLGDKPVGVTATHICDAIPEAGATRHASSGNQHNLSAGLDQIKFVRGSEMPYAVNRDARIEAMDRQGVEAMVLYPSVGIQIWPALAALGDDALYANLSAFNAFVADDWGYAYKNRIFGAPVMVLKDPDLAVAELERLLARGVRVIFLLGNSPRMGGPLPGDRRFDPFWARVEEAGIKVGIHSCALDYADTYSPPGHRTEYSERTAMHWLLDQERLIMDTLASLVLDDVFGRFPKVQLMVAEFGSSWVPYLLESMDRAANKTLVPWHQGRGVSEKPSEVFRRHVFVQPFESDDIAGLADVIGFDRIMFGSDFPHPEGIPQPGDYLECLTAFSEPQKRKIMRDNLAGLLRL